TGSSDGAKLNENTALIGYGHEFLPGVVFGIALGNTELHTKTSEQTVKTQGTGLYLYGLYNHQQVFVDATLTAGSLHTDSSRSLASAGLTATGSASGSYAGVSVNAGYRFYLSGKHLFVAPYVGAGYLHTHRNAYTESGAGLLDLRYSAADDTLSTVSAGARVGSDFELGADNTLAPWMSLGETVYGGDRSVHQTVTLGSEQQVLPASGAPSSATVLDTGLTLSRGANWLTQLAYHGQYASGSHMNTADLKVVYRW
ncbi:autotransporter outer membrane beta-barrel domain-containing protein, partial [Acidihalobacter prosperus]